MKKITTCLLLAALSMCLASCDDNDLAKELDGTWSGDYTVSYDDGTKEKVTKTLSFSYNENSSDDDGVFVETLSGKMTISDVSGINGDLTCTYQSRIEGRYEVLLGSLYLRYRVSSLEVDIDRNDIKLTFNNAMDELDYTTNSLNYLTTTLHNVKDDLAKEVKKEVYRDLFQQYSLHDSDDEFADLEVSEGKMAFETSDMGRFTFHRQ